MSVIGEWVLKSKSGKYSLRLFGCWMVCFFLRGVQLRGRPQDGPLAVTKEPHESLDVLGHRR